MPHRASPSPRNGRQFTVGFSANQIPRNVSNNPDWFRIIGKSGEAKVRLHLKRNVLKLWAMVSRTLTFASLGVALVLLFTRTPCAQPPPSAETEPSDSIRVVTDLPDAAPADTSTVTDTLETERSDVDTLIFYSARSIEFFVDDKQTLLRGNAEVKYQKMHLRAEKITVDWENDLIIAEGIMDTVWADSARTVVDTFLVQGQPVISEAGQEIVGELMTYNLKSRRGRVTEGTTQYQEGYYWGDTMQKEPDDVLYAGPGSFTTCDKEGPHYCFYTQQMKLMV
jgi:hypothetical protein